jgi:spore germination cell wall hydrolase CwlJ-like protein
MRPAATLSGLALCALVGWAGAAGDGGRAERAAAAQEEKAEAAESKAETLEEKASSEGSGRPPKPGEIITPTEAQAVDPKGKEALDDAITCLARSIYWETKGEDLAGMQAVANVVMNRLGQPGFPDTVCGVVKQGRESGSCQFSWWCDGRPDTVQETHLYSVAKEVARQALNGQLADRTGGATYFHHKRVAPRWSKTFTRTAVIGPHRFYKPADGDGKPRPKVAAERDAPG